MATMLPPQIAPDGMAKGGPDHRLATPATTPPNEDQAQPASKDILPVGRMTRQKRKAPVDCEGIAEPPTKKYRKQVSVKKASSREPATKVAVSSKPTSGKETTAFKKRQAQVKKHATKPKTSTSKIVTTTTSPHSSLLLEPQIHNKIKQVETLIHQNSTSVLHRLEGDKQYHKVRVPELTLIGALIAMRVDYNIGTRSEASISDVEDIILERYTDAVGQLQNQPWMVIDVSKPGSFEIGIRTKLGKFRRGLRANLLEAQLEMMARSQAKMDYDDIAGLSDAKERQASFDEIWARVKAKYPPSQA